MTGPSPITRAAAEIPRWPKTTAILNPDGTGRLTINGNAEDLEAGDLARARAIVLERVTSTAIQVGRPVRLNTTDPDGHWELAVHPDGQVHELAAQPTTPKKAQAPTRTPRPPRRPQAAGLRRQILRRVGAGLALLAVIVSATAVAISTSNHAPAPAGARTPTAPAVGQSAANASAANGRRHVARRAQIANVRRKHLANRRAAHKRAIAKHAARRRATARRAKARAVARARAHRHALPVPAPPIRVLPQPPAAAPSPPPPPPCGAFDLC